MFIETHFYYNKDDIIMQDILKDTKNGKEMPWREKKMDNILLGESYRRLAFTRRLEAVSQCGNFLDFRPLEDGSLKLVKANFCKVRLCPMCSWRRSKKIYGQVSKVMNWLEENHDYMYIFVTLTVKNVTGDLLSSAIDNLFVGLKSLTKTKQFKLLSNGYFRALEVTHDVNEFITSEMYYGDSKKHIKGRSKYYRHLGLKVGDKNPNFNTYHPHFHMVIAVNKRYFKDSSIYLSQQKWVQLWKSCLGIDYDPVVDVRTVKPFEGNTNSYGKAVSEVAKYTVKSSDYLIKPDKDWKYVDAVVDKCNKITDEAVFYLDSALHNRRLVGFGGKFKEVHKLLNLDDSVNGDLINTDNDDELRDDLNSVLISYCWNIGFGNYIRFE